MSDQSEPPHKEPKPPGDTLRMRDEILQLMYWLRGERLTDSPTRSDFLRFLHVQPSQLDEALRDLSLAGLVAATETGFRLTDAGDIEAGRRFQEEFAPFLGREAHLECDEPECDCHTPEFTGVCRNVIQ